MSPTGPNFVFPAGNTGTNPFADANTYVSYKPFQFPTAPDSYVGVYDDPPDEPFVEEGKLSGSEQRIVDAVLADLKPQLDAIEEALRLLVEE